MRFCKQDLKDLLNREGGRVDAGYRSSMYKMQGVFQQSDE